MSESCKYNPIPATQPLVWQSEKVISLYNRRVLQIHPSMPVYQVQGEKVSNLSFVYTGEGQGDNFGQWVVIFSTINSDCVWEAIALFNSHLVSNNTAYPPLGPATIAGVILKSDCIKVSHAGLQALKEVNGGSLPVYISPGSLGLSVSKHQPGKDVAKSGPCYRVFGNIRISF